ncbi:LLM class flavin-dependent oxidoreductase [Streptomyces sp. NPDC020858]|uniref:LLM class flavin-dependent oxidoreductase n=1 Tax=Streptomyces sp. NPDC020858 TaxID=3365097 RepID=UPI0037A027AA
MADLDHRSDVPIGGKVSVYFPLQPRDPRQVAPFARLVVAGHADRLWMGQSLNLDTHQVLAHLLGQGISPAMGIGLSLMPLTHPFQAAVAARSLAALSGKPLTAVFGTGSSAFRKALNQASHDSPLKVAEEYITEVTRLLRSPSDGARGADVDPGLRLDPARTGPPVETGLGVLQARMARLAARSADVALTWMTPLPYMEKVLLPVFDTADGPRVVSVVHVLVRRPGRDVGDAVLRATRNHLSGSHYRRTLSTAGVRLDGNDTDIARELVDHGVVLLGTCSDIAAAVSEYWAAGIDEVVLNPCAFLSEGPEEALRDLVEISTACRTVTRPRGKETPWATRT